jgi:hypothetical protein
MYRCLITLGTAILATIAPATTPKSPIDNYIGRTLLLHVADNKSVVLDVLPDNKLRYVDARTFAGKNAPENSYLRQVRYRITDEGWFCVVRERDTCFELPELKTSEFKTVQIKAYDVQEKLYWSGSGVLMLLEERPSYSGSRR